MDHGLKDIQRSKPMLDRETIMSGGSPYCTHCCNFAKFGIYESGAGFYVGSYCACGPFSRESCYYANETHVKIALSNGTIAWRIDS
jgi:hypothetical protein